MSGSEGEELGPGQSIALVHGAAGTPTLATTRWGLVTSWTRAGRPLLHARAETATTKPTFPDIALRRACTERLEAIEDAYRAGAEGTAWNATRWAGTALESDIVEAAAGQADAGVHPCLAEGWAHWWWIATIGPERETRSRLDIARFWLWGRLGEPARNPLGTTQGSALAEAERRSTAEQVKITLVGDDPQIPPVHLRVDRSKARLDLDGETVVIEHQGDRKRVAQASDAMGKRM